MLAAVGHTTLQQAVHQAFGQQRDDARVASKGAVANHAAFAVVEVQHRREAEVYAAGTQLGAQHVTAGGGGVGGGELVLDPALAQRAHGRQLGKAIAAKALHAPAFMVHADQEVFAHAFNLGAEVAELLAVFPVAGKQDDAASQRMPEAAAVGLVELEAGNVDDEGGMLGHGNHFRVTLKFIAACAGGACAVAIFSLQRKNWRHSRFHRSR